MRERVKVEMLKDNGNKKKLKLDWKCNECRKRYSIEELISLGYAEKIGNLISIECPNCENKEFVKK